LLKFGKFQLNELQKLKKAGSRISASQRIT